MGRTGLVLWDIDHTLIETGGVGREVFGAAFEIATGVPMRQQTDPTGLTEPTIFTRTLLVACDREPRLSQSVLSGNTRQASAAKLETFDLARCLDLDIGAYGDDAPDRPVLVPFALRRASSKLGHGFTSAEVLGNAGRGRPPERPADSDDHRPSHPPGAGLQGRSGRRSAAGRARMA